MWVLWRCWSQDNSLHLSNVNWRQSLCNDQICFAKTCDIHKSLLCLAAYLCLVCTKNPAKCLQLGDLVGLPWDSERSLVDSNGSQLRVVLSLSLSEPIMATTGTISGGTSLWVSCSQGSVAVKQVQDSFHSEQVLFFGLQPVCWMSAGTCSVGRLFCLEG